MNLCAHTMGTPEVDVFRAAELFSTIGFQAIELICTDDYRCAVNLDWTSDLQQQLRRHLAHLNLRTACITPYLKNMNSLNEELRVECMKEAKQVITMAHNMESAGIRMLAGVDVPLGDRAEATRLLVEALMELSEYSRPYGVELWVENHMGSLADSAAATADIVKQVRSDNVGIVYDQANLIQLGAEGYEEALRIQAPYIRHVHVKDKAWYADSRAAKLLGEGHVNWEQIVMRLQESGYEGYYCHEYERRWYPDELPPAETGMAHGYKYLSKLLK
jgi:L-ribulose-5-phosphate 3-epimerase